MYSEYVHLVDKKGAGVDGGGSVQAAWRTRDLTDELADTGGICTLAANQFALEAGVYRCMASVPIYQSNFQSRLYNITDAALELLGTVGWNSSVNPRAVTRSLIYGRFTILAQKTFEIQYQCTTSEAGNGLGISNPWTDNIYTVVELWQET